MTPLGPAGFRICMDWQEVEPVETQVWYPIYLSWDDRNPGLKGMPFNYPVTGMLDEESPEPAGFPAVTARKIDNGLAVHICGDQYLSLLRFGYPGIRHWLKELLNRAQPDPWFQTDAPSWVEIVLRTKGESLLIHFINGNPGRDLSVVNGSDLFVDEIPEIGPITISVRCGSKPEKTTLVPGGESVDAVWRCGRSEITLRKLHIHQCLVISPWRKSW